MFAGLVEEILDDQGQLLDLDVSPGCLCEIAYMVHNGIKNIKTTQIQLMTKAEMGHNIVVFCHISNLHQHN